METSKKPHAILIPSPGMGHLIPALELGNRLATHHNFHITFFVVLETHSSLPSSSISQVIESANNPKLLDVIELPPVDITGKFDASAVHFLRLPAVMKEVKPSLRSAISALKLPPSAIIFDLFGTSLMEIADEFRLLKYGFILSGVWPLSLMLYAPTLDKQVTGEFIEPVKIPGCKPVRPEDIVNPMMNRSKPVYKGFITAGEELTKTDGILVNSWEDLERSTLKALKEDPVFTTIIKVPPVYAIGPLFRPVKAQPGSQNVDQCLTWLNAQPKESVMYISFGSVGLLTAAQIIEVAWGLEMSKQRFLWVIRLPNKREKGNELENYLPEGFLDRTKDVGLVVVDWAPQAEILGHDSVGGYLSHCGWNSTLESIMYGVAMIGLPLVAENRMNAVMVSEEYGVAVRPKIWPTQGLVRREEIEEMVRRVVEEKEGEVMRGRVKELKISGEKALGVGGSSFNALSELGKQCLGNMQH